MAITAGFTVSTPYPYTSHTITDASTYTSPTRAAVGVFFKGFKKDYLGNRTSLTTTGNDSDPNTDVSWAITYTIDGWYEYLYAAIPDYDAGTTYALYDCAFDTGTAVAYRSLQDGNVGNALSNTSYWEVVSEPWLLYDNVGEVNESANITVYSYNRVLSPITKKAFGDCTALAALEARSDAKRSIDVEKYEFIGLAVDAMYNEDERLSFSSGEKIARRAALIIADC